MAMTDALLRIRGAAALLLVVLLGTTLLPRNGLAQTAAPPPGAARIWIYRTSDPYITLQTPYIRINGAIVGVARLGVVFYRDVPPGNYQITVDSRGSAPNQFAQLALAAGQVAYVKVDANNWWTGMCWWCRVDTFYTLLVSPQLAQLEMPAPPAAGG